MFQLLQPISLTLLLLGVTLWVSAQNVSSYKPTLNLKSTSVGRYRPATGAKYRPSNDGRYRGGNDGRYIHKDVKYSHDGRDGGQGVNNKIHGDGAKSLGTASGSYNVPKSGFDHAHVVKPSAKGKGTAEGGNDWAIIHLKNQLMKDGYHYFYETENGILAEESGIIEKLRKDEGLRSKGFYEYTGDDGLLYRVDYVADDNGFVAHGDHLPTQPPHVAKLLAYLEANAHNKRN